MRNRIRFWEVIRSIALVAIIGLTMTACDNGLDTKTGPKCDCIVKVHPYGSPCACPAAGTSACTCTEAEPSKTGPECDCTETVHPSGEPCDCPVAGTSACTCTEEGAPPETGPECECTETVHPNGEPCTCPAAGTSACTCTEEGAPVTGPKCDCIVKVHPHGEPCTCAAAGTSACTCTEESFPITNPECNCIETVHPYSSPCACPAEGTSFCNCTRAEPQTFIVTFDADNGTAAAAKTVTEGGKAIKPANPTKSEYGFEYWFNTATNIEWDFNAAVTANLTLKAKWFHQSLYMDMVYVGGGSFEMGDDYGEGDETPAHTVTLTGFYLGKYEVTQKEWETVMGWVYASPSFGEGDNYPVYDICWYETLEFCNRLSILEGLTPAYSISGTTDPDEWGDYYYQWDAWDNAFIVYGSNGYRLPTEAQWEYAAKGGPFASKPYFTYSGSNNANEVANIGGSLMEVGSKNANQLGLYDMSGNVFEWCWDWYDDEHYSEAQFDPMPNPAGPFNGSDRVMRGGCYRTQLTFARSVKRLSELPEEWHESVGFRVVRPAQ